MTLRKFCNISFLRGFRSVQAVSDPSRWFQDHFGSFRKKKIAVFKPLQNCNIACFDGFRPVFAAPPRNRYDTYILSPLCCPTAAFELCSLVGRALDLDSKAAGSNPLRYPDRYRKNGRNRWKYRQNILMTYIRVNICIH